MLEKIGLPTKPSLRGNNWVVDASHCQGCSSQFTFINRKHHCRRCGGIYCGSCTQQRMVLRGQGDSPVRICEPCKKLEEAARFEMRHGQRSRGGSKLTPKHEDEVLNQILGTDAKRLSGKDSSMSSGSDLQRGMSSASCSNPHPETLGLEGEGDILRSLSVDMQSDALNEMGTTSPDELRQQALEEKKKYRILKGEGKPEEALKAFKRGKDLERQAGALEVALRKNRRKVASTSSLTGIKKKNDEAEVIGKKSKPSQMGEERKDDLAAELKELGWSDADLHDADKKPAKMTLEGELSNLLGEVQQKSSSGKGTGAIDKTQVIAHKKNALMFKREGKLAEAKEELKKAKVLERQLEEQEFLADAEDSDDELSSLIRSMDDDKSDDLLMQYEKDPLFDSVPLVNFSDDYGIDGNIEVMDEDMDDPEMALTLKSLGWTEDLDHQEEAMPQVVPIDREALRNEILALKREALNQKRAGNNAEAMAQLKKAKLLEKDLESTQLESQETAYLPTDPVTLKVSTSQIAEKSKLTKVADASVGSVVSMGTKPPPKSKLMIQRELLALKKKALTLRREGRLDEAEEELKKGKALEQQLDEMENPSKVSANKVSVVDKGRELRHGDAFVSGSLASGEEGDEEEVTEQDMHDPALLSLLENLGWKEDVEPVAIASRPKQNNYPTENASNSSVNEVPEVPVVAPRRSKAQMQRELLGLKRKALTLRRQGNTEEAEEVLVMAKELEAQMEEMDVPKKVMPLDSMMNTEVHGLGPLIAQKNHGNTAVVEDVGKDVAESLIDLGLKESNTARPSPRSSAISVSEICQTIQDNNVPLIEDLSPRVDTRISEDAGHAHQTVNLMDLPAEGAQKGSQSTFGATESTVVFDANILSHADPDIHTGITRSPNKEVGMKGENLSEKLENTVSMTGKIHEAKTSSVSESFNDQNSLRQEILARKRKAVALKREGKLAEAREELRQTKLLEKNLINDNPQPSAQHTTPVASVSTSNDSSIGQEEPKTTKPTPKPMSSRDRFKLQQQSLAHKRQAMKLRREGRMEEAEAESELAKALESQLEELTAQDSSKSEAMDDVGIEDFLDPQLLSALKAIGLQDAQPLSKSPEKSEPAKPNAEKVENSSQERSQLEERIKAEKVKAVNLKRAGKQAEALDALRRAKQYEKKLTSLVS